MSGRSKKSKRKTFEATPSVISSTASTGGVTPSDSQGWDDCETSGPAPVLANLSLRPAKAKAKKTNDISGLPSLLSSASVALTGYSVSRLAAKLGSAGSIEYSLTSTTKAMPCRLRIFRLRASAHRTSAKDSSGAPSGWATPVAQPANGEPEDFLRRKQESVDRGSSMGIVLSDLQMQAIQYVGYPMPQASDAERASEEGIRGETNPTLLGAARKVGWASPTAGDAIKEKAFHDALQPALAYQCQLTGWTSPRVTDAGRIRSQEAIEKAQEKGGAKSLDDDVQKAGWQTPTVTDAMGRDYTYPSGDHDKPFLTLPGQARTAGWASPTARDHKDQACAEADVPTKGLLGRQAVRLPVSGTIGSASSAPTTKSVALRLNPSFSLALQAYPREWSLSSPGWDDWETIQRLLERYYGGLEPTAKDA